MSETKVKSNGCFMYIGPSGLLVPDANKALEMIGGGGGLYVAGAKLEREHVINAAVDAHQDVMMHGLKPGASYRKLLEERCGSLSVTNKSNQGRMIGVEARKYVMWSLGAGGDEPAVGKTASAAALGFLEWADAHKFVPQTTERRYFDERIGYSIEVDAVGMLNGKLTALMIAIGPKLYEKHPLELAAAVNAANLQLGEVTAKTQASAVSQGLILRLPRSDEDFAAAPFEAVLVDDKDELQLDLNAFAMQLGVWQRLNHYERKYHEEKVVLAKPKYKAVTG